MIFQVSVASGFYVFGLSVLSMFTEEGLHEVFSRIHRRPRGLGLCRALVSKG